MFHGFLQTAPSFTKMITSEHNEYFQSTKTSFIVPTAPRIELTGSDIHPYFPGPTKHLDPKKRAWLDIKSKLHIKTPEKELFDMSDVDKLCENLHVSQIIPMQREVTLLGFSQGGGVALELGLNYFPEQYNRKVDKLILLSSFMTLDCHLWPKLASLKERNLLPNKILICHGGEDKMVPKSWATHTFKNLKKYVDDTTFIIDKTGGHEPSRAVWQKTLEFLES